MAQIRVGTSGWSYAHWRGRFYPEKLPARDHFSFYASHFDTVELNNSFYRQPPRERFEAWARQSPEGFLFAVKGSRYITHIKRLQIERDSVERVVEAARGLGDRLGPILFQFPASFRLDLDRLDAFLPMLEGPERFTLEFRHDSWLTPEVYARLRDHRIALCIPDHPKMPQACEITTDFTYVRMHLGASGIGYSRPALRAWAGRLLAWRQAGTASYVYFNNDMEGYAIRNAKTFLELLDQS
jgi:uncharacterized protein YecE (DUF72 family)